MTNLLSRLGIRGGSLVLIAVLLLGSAVLRLGFEAGPALAREASEPSPKPAADQGGPATEELGTVLAAFLVFLRVSAIVSVLPAFGESSVPVRVKLGLAVAFTAIVASAVSPIGIPLTPVELFAFTAAEIIVGLALGLAIRLFVMALQTAGAMAAQSTSLSQIMGSAGVEPMPAMGHVLVVAGLALAVMTGLHVRVAELLIKSYSVFPAGHFPDPRSLTWWGMVRVAKAFTLAFSLAAPFLIASMLYNLTLGVINRAMPQLMVAFIGAPVITLGGLFLLVLCTPLMLHVWAEALASFISDPIGAGQ